MSKDSIAKQIASAAYDIAFKNGFSNAQLMRIKNSVESIVETIEQERAVAEETEKLGDMIRDYIKKYHRLTITVGEYNTDDVYNCLGEVDISNYDYETEVKSEAKHISVCFYKDEENEDW